MDSAGNGQTNIKKIVVQPDGPYDVQGNIPLVRKSQIVSEYGEPLTWKKEETIPTGETYSLCRCGQSHTQPFCDSTHYEVFFDGTETADPGLTADRQVSLQGSDKILVRKDSSLCMGSGFCANRLTDIEGMLYDADDPQVRAQVMRMIEHCPSGTYVYSLQKDEPDIEPDLPEQIALTTEITSDGPIEGSLWVTGNIPIERSDGQFFETRNRVTLCSCGLSQNKPLCDGTHREEHTKKLRNE